MLRQTKQPLFFFIVFILIFFNHYKTFSYTPYGHWSFSTGFHAWSDHIDIKNAQLRSLLYLNQHWRINTVLRSNKEFREITPFEPKIDELYLQWQWLSTHQKNQNGVSIKIGEMRYLRFPKPDIISQFDQVPGTEDLSQNKQTSYRGIMLNQEYNITKTVGFHSSLLQWIASEQSGLTLIEGYLYYRKHTKTIDFETRLGQLAERNFPLGNGSFGYSSYIGINYRDFKAGVLIESLESEGIRTGILVEFSNNPINAFLGKMRADYTRSPQGIGIQPTLLRGTFGMTKTIPENKEKVGEIVVRQTITYWQNGQGRNFYEHILSKSGKTSSSHVTMKTYPTYLKIESLVSKHHTFKSWDDLIQWEKERQGPAELATIVVYSFYE